MTVLGCFGVLKITTGLRVQDSYRANKLQVSAGTSGLGTVRPPLGDIPVRTSKKKQGRIGSMAMVYFTFKFKVNYLNSGYHNSIMLSRVVEWYIAYKYHFKKVNYLNVRQKYTSPMDIMVTGFVSLGSAYASNMFSASHSEMSHRSVIDLTEN